MDALFSSNGYTLNKKVLDANALQYKGIASNIANAETPGYRRVELSKDFQTQLAALSEAGNYADINALNPILAEDSFAPSTKPDGNNVEIDRELLEMNRATVGYQAAAQFLSGSLKHLNTAITGRTQ